MATKQSMQTDVMAAEKEVKVKTAMFVKGDLATMATAAREDAAARKQRKAPNAALSIALSST